jgi:AcrR family transcriptional regulator
MSETVTRSPRKKAASRPGGPALRRRIFDAARRRLERYGYRHTTMSEIARDAGVAKGTVYLYYAGKEDLVAAIVGRILTRLEARMRAVVAGGGGAAPRLQRLLVERVLLLRAESRRAPAAYALIHALEDPHVDRVVRGHMAANEAIVADLVAEGVASRELAAVDPVTTARTLLVAFHALQSPRFLARGRRELVALATELAGLLVGGLARRGGGGRPPRGGLR